jgi:hypothetical protein
LLQEDCGIRNETIDRLHQESSELIGIFTTMVSKLRKLGDL